MLLSDAGFVCLASLLHVSGVLGEDITICALKGSTVELPCSYKKLYTKHGDGTNSMRELSVDGNRFDDSTLTLKDLRQSDSTTYYCGSSQTNVSSEICLQVTDLEVKVLVELMRLGCSTSCTLKTLPSYNWYEGKRFLSEEQYLYVPRNSHDSYSCAIKNQTTRSPAVCLPQRECWSVNYVNRRICFLRGSTVDIFGRFSIPSGNEVKSLFWFTEWKGREPKDLKQEDNDINRVEYFYNHTNYHVLKIKNLTKQDSAEYSLRVLTNTASGKYAGIPGVVLNVTDLKVTMRPSTTTTNGGRVTLSCVTSCPLTEDPAFIWYQNGRPLTPPEHTAHNNQLVLHPVEQRHTGNYSCSVISHRDLRSPEKTLTVGYPPETPSLTRSPSGEMAEGGSVTLTCSSDAKPPAEYTWYKESIDSPKAAGQNYTITNITSEDFGAYYCQARNQFGEKNSTSLPITREGKSASIKSTVLGVVILLSLAALFFICWFIMKRKNRNCTAKDTEQTGQAFTCPVYDNIAAGTGSSVPAGPTEQQDDLNYVSIRFPRPKDQDVRLHSAVQPDQTQRQEDDTQYAVVNFNRSQAAGASDQAGADLSELYSTVNKNHNPH